MSVYRCWGDDHEDLTDKVEQAVATLPKGGGIVAFERRRAEDEPDGPRRQVMVTCSRGHENVFGIGD